MLVYFLCVLFTFTMRFIMAASVEYPNSTILDDYDAAEETQHTFCKIATEELQATANATITRELKGVCTTKELKRAMAAILREIETLKDALVLKTHIDGASSAPAKQSRRNKRKNRKNLLELFAVSNAIAQNNNENLFIPMNNGQNDGRYSYYWTLTDVEQYLQEGASLKSPIITYQGVKYYLRLTIVDNLATIQLITKNTTPEIDETYTHYTHYTIYVLSKNGVKDLRLDATNAYSATLRRLRQFKRDTNTIFIKLVIE